MRVIAAALIALAVSMWGSGTTSAQSLSAEDLQYLQARYGMTKDSAVLTELTPNEVQSLHSAIDDLKSYPAGRDRSVQSYLALAYGRECKRWAREHQDQPCSPPPDPAVAPGKAISDKHCATCHLFGTPTATSFHQMAGTKVWDAHKVEHALKHNPAMVPIKLSPQAIEQLAAYINSLK